MSEYYTKEEIDAMMETKLNYNLWEEPHMNPIGVCVGSQPIAVIENIPAIDLVEGYPVYASLGFTNRIVVQDVVIGLNPSQTCYSLNSKLKNIEESLLNKLDKTFPYVENPTIVKSTDCPIGGYSPSRYRNIFHIDGNEFVDVCGIVYERYERDHLQIANHSIPFIIVRTEVLYDDISVPIVQYAEASDGPIKRTSVDESTWGAWA
jgi:hypothetical protein